MDSSPSEGHDGYITDCVATPGEVLRTALRVMILNLHRGLACAPPRLRQSEEAKAASQAIYAASWYFNKEFDPARLEVELGRLGEALKPLAAKYGCDPFMLHLYATGEIRQWRRRKRTSERPLHSR